VTFIKNNPVPFFVPEAQYVGRNNRITVDMDALPGNLVETPNAVGVACA
jgi:hypothetical protein